MDTITLVDIDCNISELLSLINSIDPCIQFTFEVEINNQLPFLDVLVLRTAFSFSTSVYCKLFAVSFPPHFRSNHPIQQEMVAFYSYVSCGQQICSDSSSLDGEISYLKSLAFCRVILLPSLTKLSRNFAILGLLLNF